MNYNNFIDIKDNSQTELKSILEAAHKLKSELKKGIMPTPLKGKHLAMIFEKSSTRTRVSFEVAINQLGGHAVLLSNSSSQIGRGETIADTARVLARYVDIIMMRTFEHNSLTDLADFAKIPVINGLTDHSHPCQIMADILTIEEKLGTIAGKTVAWVGDWNNMSQSWVEAADKLNFTLNIACPEVFTPSVNSYGNTNFFTNPQEAVKNAHCVTTDTWVSMGDTNADEKRAILANFQVNDALMELADGNAIFLHCLPAHRDEEVTTSVIDGPQSAIWDEAENRLHIQKAIILWCLNLLPHQN